MSGLSTWAEAMHPRGSDGKFAQGRSEKVPTLARRNEASSNQVGLFDQPVRPPAPKPPELKVEAPESVKESAKGTPLMSDNFSSVQNGTNLSTAKLLMGMDHVGVKAYLGDPKNRPALNVGVTPDMRAKGFAGIYRQAGRSITIDAHSSITGPAKSWGTTFTVGEKIAKENPATEVKGVGTNGLNAKNLRNVQGTLIHEMGHHIHMDNRDPSLYAKADAVVTQSWNQRFPDKTLAANISKGASLKNPAISKYATENRFEYFAESFHAYLTAPEALAKHDPIGHQMVKSVFAVRGIRDT